MKYYSNEIVFRGHPDKVCDQISGAILKELIKQDRNTRAGIECMIKNSTLIIAGEITTNAKVDYAAVANRVFEDIGYHDELEVEVKLSEQSHDIALGTNDEVGGAGDNGMMFGYACNDTPQMLPTAQVILQEFAEAYDKLVQEYPNMFYPDGKAQITGEYDKHFKLRRIKTFTICYQNSEKERDYTDSIIRETADKISLKYGITVEEYLINPTGAFKIGGPEADAGLTGRKIVVDAYQSFANVGGGCMNGKDPSKVDFSGAHMARHIAKKELIRNKLKWCEVQLSYAIGREQPLAIYINSDKGEIMPLVRYYIDCTPRNMIDALKLKYIDYEELAKFGHFRD